MKIGIVGSSGVLGQILVGKLLNSGHKDISCFEGDICSKSDIDDWLSKHSFGVIFHLAAIIFVDEIENDALSAYDVNVGGTINLLSAIKKHKQSPWFFYASTCHVYKSKDGFISENDLTDPISLYGTTKLMGEKVCLDTVKNKDCSIDVCVGRIFSIYHSTQTRKSLYPNILNRLKEENLDEPFFLPGANCQRDMSNAEDVVDSIIMLMNKRVNGIINIGSGKPTKIRDFVQKFTDKKLQIVTDQKKDTLVADITKLRKIF